MKISHHLLVLTIILSNPVLAKSSLLYDSMLCDAAKNLDIQSAERSIRLGANPNADCDPLKEAIFSNQIDKVENKASSAQKIKFLDTLFNAGTKIDSGKERHALGLAVEVGGDVFDSVLKQAKLTGFDIDHPKSLDGNALHTAMYVGDTGAVKKLIAAGANPNKKINEFQETPLMYTFIQNHETILALLAAGAHVSSKNIEGKTAFDLNSDYLTYLETKNKAINLDQKISQSEKIFKEMEFTYIASILLKTKELDPGISEQDLSLILQGLLKKSQPGQFPFTLRDLYDDIKAGSIAAIHDIRDNSYGIGSGVGFVPESSSPQNRGL